MDVLNGGILSFRKVRFLHLNVSIYAKERKITQEY